ncbi:MAG TPA: hypothetical protein VHW90_04315, partial [Stellaceae bacterium]|nr:hypothetical protein [Stellaceae bacterium]
MTQTTPPGTQYVFFAQGQSVAVARTPDGSTNLAQPVGGAFNLELVTSPSGSTPSLAGGFSAVAFLPGGTGQALSMESGNYGVADTGTGDAITLTGSGAQTVIGAIGDSITGGVGGSDLINAIAQLEYINA